MNDIDLPLTRNIDTKNIDTPLVFKTEDFRKHFEVSVVAFNKQFAAADWLVSIGKKSEAEDVWRSQIVFLSSTFDFYMHELTRYGLIQLRNIMIMGYNGYCG